MEDIVDSRRRIQSISVRTNFVQDCISRATYAVSCWGEWSIYSVSPAIPCAHFVLRSGLSMTVGISFLCFLCVCSMTCEFLGVRELSCDAFSLGDRVVCRSGTRDHRFLELNCF